VLEEERDNQDNLKKIRVESVRYVESGTALINRVLGREIGGKQNILVMPSFFLNLAGAAG
jgi:type III restriction enzyme